MTAKVLLLEDDADVRLTFSMAFQEAGYDLTAVTTCSEAISALTELPLDVLVLDLMIGEELTLPVADYAALLRPDIPVVCITGSRLFSGGELFTLSRNIRWVLRKPVNLSDLLSMVDHVTGRVAARAAG